MICISLFIFYFNLFPCYYFPKLENFDEKDPELSPKSNRKQNTYDCSCYEANTDLKLRL